MSCRQCEKVGHTDFLIHSIGWDKDADLNTITGYQVEPLPFVGMQQYPPVDDRTVEAVDTPEYRHYLEQYQTRSLIEGTLEPNAKLSVYRISKYE